MFWVFWCRPRPCYTWSATASVQSYTSWCRPKLTNAPSPPAIPSPAPTFQTVAVHNIGPLKYVSWARKGHLLGSQVPVQFAAAQYLVLIRYLHGSSIVAGHTQNEEHDAAMEYATCRNLQNETCCVLQAASVSPIVELSRSREHCHQQADTCR